MIKMNDGSILIQAAVDGPFEPSLRSLGAVRIKGVSVADPLLVHQIEHGRPQSLSHAEKQERIKALIKEMRSRISGLTFAQAWEHLQKTRPDLFDAPR
jgi:hypothetical protein